MGLSNENTGTGASSHSEPALCAASHGAIRALGIESRGIAIPRRGARLLCASRAPTSALAIVVLAVLAGGCQTVDKVSQRRLIEHQAMIDFSGLKPVETIESIRVRAAAPRQWEAMPLTTNALYAHQQWKSPSGHTGVGAAHIRLPLPLSERMVMWLAKREYTKKANDGRVLSEWTDDLGRPWFEAENNKYRVRGYVVVHGFNAWVIYFGSKSKYPPDPAELSLAARAAESIVPVFGKVDPVADSTPPSEAALVEPE